MKKYFYQWLLLCAMTFVAACSDGGEEIDNPQTPSVPEQPTITLGGSSSSDFPTDGGSNTLSFTASTDWTAEVINSRADAWCSVSPTSGKAGNAQITITTTANDTPDNRSASVILKAGTTQKTITVSQKQKDALTVTSDKFEVSAEGGEIKIEVKANIDYEYSIAYEGAAKDWITSGGARALKTSTLTFKVAANEEVEKREATVTIKSGSFKEEVKVYQAGTTPSITLTKNEFVVASAGESIAVEVKSNVDVTVELPTDVDWISENQSRAMSTNTYHFTIAESQEYDQRTAEIKFTNKANNLSETVKVVQVQKDAIVVAKNSYTVDNDGDEIIIEVGHNIDFDIEIGTDWISLFKTRSLETTNLRFLITKNQTLEKREGIVKLVANDKDITQNITFIQERGNVLSSMTCAPNEILYTTKYNLIIELSNNKGFGGNLVYNIYENGIGRLIFGNDVTAIPQDAFKDCNSMEYILLPDGVKSIGANAFSGCSNLKRIIIPSNTESISQKAFANCYSLEYICIPTYLKSWGAGLFEGCTGKILYNGPLPEFKNYTKFGVFIGSRFSEINIGENVQNIGSYSFYNCIELTKVSIPDKVRDIGLAAFKNCI